MRILAISDLHLETVPYPGAFGLPPVEFDVLVVAGDVWEGNPTQSVAVAARLAAGRRCVYVMGNHEPWRLDLDASVGEARAAADFHGVTLLEADAAEISGVTFVGGTLWTDGMLGGLIDDRTARTGDPITVAGQGLSLAEAAARHARAVVAVETAFAASNGPVVVVTHHAPLPGCLSPELRGRPVSGILASDLSRLTDAGRASLWIHGHVHHNVDLTRPGGTRVVCNPAGYAMSNPGFDDGLVFEIEQ